MNGHARGANALKFRASGSRRAFRGDSKGRLLRVDEVDDHRAFNRDILTGYRPATDTCGCICSLGYVHNETGNVVTHGKACPLGPISSPKAHLRCFGFVFSLFTFAAGYMVFVGFVLPFLLPWPADWVCWLLVFFNLSAQVGGAQLFERLISERVLALVDY